MRKVTSWEFRKCCSFWDLEVLNHSYRLPKSTQISNFVGTQNRCSKKRHGHNFEFWAPPLNQRGTNRVGPTLIQWQRSKLIIVAVSFFLTPHNYRDAFTFSAMCWLWRVITGAKITVALINYTFSDSSGRKLQHGPMLEIFFFEYISFEEWALNEKNQFFAIFEFPQPKKSKDLFLGHYWSLTPCP